MSDIEHRLKQLEDDRKSIIVDHNKLMQLCTKVEMLDPTAIIEFKAVAITALKKISSDLGRLEVLNNETKNLIVSNKETMLEIVNNYKDEANKKFVECDTKITIQQVKAAGWGSLGGTTFGIIASYIFKLLVGN